MIIIIVILIMIIIVIIRRVKFVTVSHRTHYNWLITESSPKLGALAFESYRGT